MMINFISKSLEFIQLLICEKSPYLVPFKLYNKVLAIALAKSRFPIAFLAS